jgi:hypothetical protein
MRLCKWLVLLLTLLALNACVPVVVVGAAGLGKGYLERPDGVESVVSEQSGTAVSEVETFPVETPPEVRAEPEVVAPAAQAKSVAITNEVVNSPQPPSTSTSQADALEKLTNRGWKVSINNGQIVDGAILYFDLDRNFYGFDGCRYFKGKYQADASGSFLINSLIVSGKGSNSCGNDVTKSLFFVDAFKLEQDGLVLQAKNTLAMSLTLHESFDAKEFLNKAKFKNRKRR